MTRSATQLVLFDLDGTLADTRPDLLGAVDQAIREAGLPAPDLARVSDQISHGGRAMISAGLANSNPATTLTETRFEIILDRFLELYRQQIANQTQLFPGMAQVLQWLEQARIKWGIVTNKRSSLTKPLVAALDLHQRAACVISGDSAAHAKPHPDSLIMALEQTTCSANETVYIGDAQNDVRAARAAGILAVVARYGYIASDENTGLWNADAYIDQPLDLLNWLNNR